MVYEKCLFAVPAWLIYIVIEESIRAAAFSSTTKRNPSWPTRDIGEKWWILVTLSPGYLFARYYKSRIGWLLECEDLKRSKRGDFIRKNNNYNIVVSTLLFILLAVSRQLECSVAFYMVANLVLFRMISKGCEIAYAFGKDALSNKNSSGLTKYDRISLAVRSYFETFIFSAGFYLGYLIAPDSEWWQAFTYSLSVGTLTNVAMAFQPGYCWISNFAFVQVLTTLSLVLLGLAVYISRTE